MTTNNAEFVSQICTRRVDFQKPVRAYKVVELFGKNVLSCEGSTWRAHRKATAPAFSEELHGLVWTETLQQIDKMFVAWQSRGSKTPDRLDVDDLGRDTIALTLHIISKAGFGVPLAWPGQKHHAQESNDMVDFSGEEPLQGHDLTFKAALEGTVSNILWFAVFSPCILGKFTDANHDEVGLTASLTLYIQEFYLSRLHVKPGKPGPILIHT